MSLQCPNVVFKLQPKTFCAAAVADFMDVYMNDFSEFGIQIPEILLPAKKDLSTWSVIACDQYTQDLSYWKKVEEIVSTSPSTLNLILPEVYLNSADRKDRIEKIKSTMKNYLSENIFDKGEKEFIYIERKTQYGRCRSGLVCAIDLDSYEWEPFSKSFIRATEATIVDRIPPRKEIRNGAALELPHIMLLVNDEKKSFVEKCGQLAKKNAPLYDGDLMMNAGHITGWAVKSDEEMQNLYDALKEIKSRNTDADGSSFMFAVGDGNHSLATAKAVWDQYKKENTDDKNSSVRYALVEIVNIYDEGLTFEPIHRVLFNADAKKLISFVKENLDGKLSECQDEKSLEEKVHSSTSSFGFVYRENNLQKYILLECDLKELAVSRLQPLLDDFISGENQNGNQNEKIQIDYIHGSNEVFRLGKEDKTLTILLPPIAKDSFFDTIQKRGPLPRKSFSMGEASEKRFYLECRKLFK